MVTKRIRAPKEKKASVSKWKGTSQAPKPVVSKIAILREDGAIKSPTPIETSSSEESSSGEESDYEDDEIPVQDISEVSSQLAAFITLFVCFCPGLSKTLAVQACLCPAFPSIFQSTAPTSID